ncbi:hypothetical protein [Aliiglaciecola sp. LCG003]|uniref:hypothetical protein n=1 Tax=Aliiglaciecola sp. LCG003 TaxID=3053655 RepID=UPI0025746937|nr:hypothetical protein [Aliiglaciecola sp. LCG003]WJG08098.1 hypothetical protein QR722_12160 [Aliiglaciecola sp. LCG003]
MKFNFFYLVLLIPLSTIASQLEESEVLHLSGAVYSFIAEVGLCGKQYPDLNDQTKRSHAFFKSIIGRVEAYYASLDKTSKFVKVEKAGVNIAGRKMMQAMSNGGISRDKCNTIIAFGSELDFPEDLQNVLSKMGS